MHELSSIQCVNCGTTLALSLVDASGVFCPVCHLFNDFSEPVFDLVLSADALEAQLGTVAGKAPHVGQHLDFCADCRRKESGTQAARFQAVAR